MARIKAELALTTSLQTLRTVASGQQLKRANLRVVNYSSADRDVEIHFVPSGGSASSATRVISMTAAGGNALDPGGWQSWLFFQNLREGDTIQAKSDAAGAVNLRAGLLEVADNPDLVEADGVLLPTSETEMLEVAANRQLTSLQLVFCNVGTLGGDETEVIVHLTNAGQSTSDATREISTKIGSTAAEASRTQAFLMEPHLGPGGKVIVQASQASILACRLGGIQEVI